MRNFYGVMLALPILVALAIFGTSRDAQAVTISYGDTVAVSSCTDADPCVFGGPLNVGYFAGVYDYFHATLTGVAGQTLALPLTASTDMQVVTSGVGGSPLGTDGSGGSGVYNLLAGVTQTLSLMFDTAGLLTLNTITPTGAVTGADSLFDELMAGTGLAFSVDGTTGDGSFQIATGGGTGSCPAGQVSDGNGGCVPLTSGGGSGGGSPNEVPLPVPGFLLLAGLGLLRCLRRRRPAMA